MLLAFSSIFSMVSAVGDEDKMLKTTDKSIRDFAEKKPDYLYN